jgi:hypothetical protein
MRSRKVRATRTLHCPLQKATYDSDHKPLFETDNTRTRPTAFFLIVRYFPSKERGIRSDPKVVGHAPIFGAMIELVLGHCPEYADGMLLASHMAAVCNFNPAVR